MQKAPTCFIIQLGLEKACFKCNRQRNSTRGFADEINFIANSFFQKA
jgi:hypothetical protein